jgi:hypothetical protein
MIRSETMEKSRREGSQHTLINFLVARTGQAVPEDLAEQIRACHDWTRLDAWTLVAAKIDTIDQFRQQTGL